MSDYHGARRRSRGKAQAGSARWFRRHRWLVVGGWLAVLVGAGWLLLIRSERLPVASSTAALTARSAAAADGETMAEVNLPADDAEHNKRTEWWYYSGHLQTASGEHYSFHLAAFLRRGALTHTVFHGSLLDHQTEKRYTEQARTAGNPSDGRQDGFNFRFADWQLQGTGEKHLAKMAGKGFALDLQLDDPHAPLLHQAPGTPIAGLLDFAAAGKSYYTSRPRMSARGTLSIDGKQQAVSGEVWFDHQWGDFEAADLRWNWFALQLTDGADIMLFELFDRQGGGPVLRMGTYARDGTISALGDADFKAKADGSWKSPFSRVAYPLDWTINIPSKGVKVQVEPVLRASEFDALTTTLNVYWEGAIKVGGSHKGVGFMELSGYQPARRPQENSGPKR
ncbi:lipocalin family protein [Accumulibacter sp.]|uniref:lipocalin family protein n=1 Tax=Accumulibacter sp. TaxID=2053492 RepID=UPI0028C43AC2|nr:lipocalin family protein [Accumulibacter sp.]